MRAHHSPHQYEELIPGLAAGAGVAQMEAGSSPAEGWSSPKSVGVKGIRKRGLLLHITLHFAQPQLGCKESPEAAGGVFTIWRKSKIKRRKDKSVRGEAEALGPG